MFKQLLNHDLLTKEDEVKLFNVLLENPGSEAAALAKSEIVEKNMKLVASIAGKFSKRGLDFEELIQEGVVGLLKAIEKFDVTRGYKFSTYATFWVAQTMDQAIVASRPIKLPIHVRERVDKVFKASIVLRKELNREPSTEEIAEFVNVKELDASNILKVLSENEKLVKEACQNSEIITDLSAIVREVYPSCEDMHITSTIRAYLRLVKSNSELTVENILKITNFNVENVEKIMNINTISSLDFKISENGDSGETSLGDVVGDIDSSAEEQFFTSENNAVIIECLESSNLNPRDIQLVIERFGLRDGQPKTLIEVGEMFEISSERARQIEARVLSKPAFILALHKNGIIDGEKIKVIAKNQDFEQDIEAFDAKKIIDEIGRLGLSNKEKLVLSRRYNLTGYGRETLAEIAEKMDLSIQYVRQIEINALKKGKLLDIVYTQGLIKKSKYEKIKQVTA